MQNWPAWPRAGELCNEVTRVWWAVGGMYIRPL